ncbi:transcriptional repressor [Candidatus Berkiella aquae]|uniref:Ferric uptake regulation protein n=1 Tax=Candidatus Berkiella aquae TaxID=295108 RepID=A0A0Q9YPJ8_9GAMM|nr:Fur family transcriptional regulator [Candidatus Berkiella aquae]MCS5709958.1 transcriptional repressor [Candidatus Berkiella aquae]
MQLNIQQRIEIAEAICRKQSVKLTPLRKMLLEILYEQAIPLTAYELLRLMREHNPKTEAMTVYRILSFLEEHQLVHRLHSCQAYAACNMPEHEHHAQLLLCEKCHRSEEIATPALKQSIDTILKEHSFCFSRKSIEIFGICQSCIA